MRSAPGDSSSISPTFYDVADIDQTLEFLRRWIAVGMLFQAVVDSGVLIDLSIEPFDARPGLAQPMES